MQIANDATERHCSRSGAVAPHRCDLHHQNSLLMNICQDLVRGHIGAVHSGDLRQDRRAVTRAASRAAKVATEWTTSVRIVAIGPIRASRPDLHLHLRRRIPLRGNGIDHTIQSEGGGLASTLPAATSSMADTLDSHRGQSLDRGEPTASSTRKTLRPSTAEGTRTHCAKAPWCP